MRETMMRRSSIEDGNEEDDLPLGKSGKLPMIGSRARPDMRNGMGHTRMISGSEDDFIMVSVSPVKGTGGNADQARMGARQISSERMRTSSSRTRMSSNSEADIDLILNREGSPTPAACGMAIATGKLSLMEEAALGSSGGMPSMTPMKRPSGIDHAPQLPHLDLDGRFDPNPFDSPVRPPPGYSRSLRPSQSTMFNNGMPTSSAKSILTRARSDSTRVEDCEGSSPSPDSVRQGQGSWIKRSKASSSVSTLPSPALGGFGEGSLFSPQRMGVRSRAVTTSSEKSDMSSSPPPPDTPIQRGANVSKLAQSRSLGRSGIPPPRFSIASSSSSRSSVAGPSATSIGGLPKSKSTGTKAVLDAGNSVFLSPAKRAEVAAWSSSKPLRPDGTQARTMEPGSIDKPRPYSESTVDREHELERERERQRDMDAETIFGSGKKAISMSDIRMAQPGGPSNGMVGMISLNKENGAKTQANRSIGHRRTGSHHGNTLLFGQKPNVDRPPPSPFQTITNRPHRKTMSDQSNQYNGMSRSYGLKAGLADSGQGGLAGTTGPVPRYGLIPKSTSGSSRSSMESSASTSATNMTTATSSTSLFPDETHFFDDIKPLQAAFDSGDSHIVGRKYKGRDSISSNNSLNSLSEEDDPMTAQSDIPAPSTVTSVFAPKPVRPAYLKRASSCGDDRDVQSHMIETPGMLPLAGSGWPTAFGIDFGASRESLGGGLGTQKPSMPDTPIKKGSFDGTAAAKSLARVGHSTSQPILSTAQFSVMKASGGYASRSSMPPPSNPPFNREVKQLPYSPHNPPARIAPTVIVTHNSSPHSPDSGGPMEQSPTIRVAGRFSESDSQLGLGTDQALPINASKRGPSGLQTGSVRMGLLRRLSSSANSTSSEMEDDENTPTKASTIEKAMLSAERK